MRRFRFTAGDKWVFTITLDGTSILVTPPNAGAVLAAVRDLRAMLPMDIPAGKKKTVRVQLRERDGEHVARVLAAIVEIRERVDLEWKELRP